MNLERNLYGGNPEDILLSSIPESKLVREEEELADFLDEKTKNFPLPNFEEFNKIYSSEQLDGDARKLREVTSQFENYSGERSNMVTRLLLHLVYDLEYLKPKDGNWEIHAGLTHPYDDKLRGSDMVIVFYNRETDTELPIAVDTTTSSAPYEKREKIEQDFKHGNLRQLRYYKSPISGKAVGNWEMPVVVLGYTPETMQIIASGLKTNGEQVFEKLRLEQGIREELAAQLEKQVKGIRQLTSADKQVKLIDQIKQVYSLIANTQEKGATEVAPVHPVQASATLSF